MGDRGDPRIHHAVIAAAVADAIPVQASSEDLALGICHRFTNSPGSLAMLRIDPA